MLKNVNGKFLQEVGLNSINPKKPVSDAATEYVDKLETVVKKLGQQWPKHSKTFANPSGFMQRIYDAFDSAAKIVEPKKLFKDTRINLSQISVWVLALLVIPIACNAIMPTIMKYYDKLTGCNDKNINSLPKPTNINKIPILNKPQNLQIKKDYNNPFQHFYNMRIQ